MANSFVVGILCSLLVCLSTFASGGESEHLYYGIPSTQKILIREAYTVSYDPQKRIPLWVAYKITPDYLNTPKRKKRFKKFRVDPYIKNAVHTKEYTNSGYARGHLAPYAISGGDRDDDGFYARLDKNSSIGDTDEEQTVFEINYFSNITPQNQRCFNGAGGVWYQLERFLQDKIVKKQQREIQVYAGVIFAPDKPIIKIGPNQDIAVPDAFYKIVFEKQEDGEVTALSFLFPHYTENPEKTFCLSGRKHFSDSEHLTTVDEIEKQSGLDFMPLMGSKQEDTIEARSSSDVWETYYQPSK